MISGVVDDYGRALISLVVRHPLTLASLTVEAWIDTAFTGRLLLTPDHVAQLGLARSTTVQGKLADGSVVVFETFLSQIEWFGQPRTVEAITGPGDYALIGVYLLEDCTLYIDYPGPRLTVVSQPATQPGQTPP